MTTYVFTVKPNSDGFFVLRREIHIFQKIRAKYPEFHLPKIGSPCPYDGSLFLVETICHKARSFWWQFWIHADLWKCESVYAALKENQSRVR